MGIVKIFVVDNKSRIKYISLMPTNKPKVLITLDDDLMERIDDFRYGNRIPSRSEAIRRLIEEALKKYQTEKP